ncbi:MAG: N-acetylmuramoyl-L-alanine amidase [Acetatifactor sp.]|nr:N-acetylmuramoyl-L-alanine amidase [Acetatifactor sp.]
MPLIALDAGHGGANPGAVYQGRQEKDDALALTMAVGRILEDRGVDVYYTRTTDIYESPEQKAMEGNQVGADYFVSIHRNSSPYPNQYSGIESLVYNRYGEAARMAYNINQQLEAVGFLNQGVNERTNLVVLNRTQMPSVLVEVGFINTDADNQLFDERFDDIAQAIADGILITLGM